MLSPHLLVLAVVVKHRHLALRHASEHGAGALTGVILALVVEEPSHLQPLGLGVHGCEALIDVLCHLIEVVGLKTGRVHLVKRINAIDVVGAKQTCLLLEEHALDAAIERVLTIQEIGAVLILKASPSTEGLYVCLGEQVPQCARHMSCKSRQHGAHIQGALTLHNAFLQFYLPIEPLLGQWSTPAVDVRHAVPRQVGRSREVGAHLLVAHAHTGPHVVPHRLLTCNSQRHVHTV